MGASTELQSAALELCREEIGPRNRVACVREVVESEGPQRKVYLSPFAIDRVEVTVAAWRACVQAGACSPAPLALADARFLRPNLPVTSVTWSEARRLLRVARRAAADRGRVGARGARHRRARLAVGQRAASRTPSTTAASPAPTTSAATSCALIRPDAATARPSWRRSARTPTAPRPRACSTWRATSWSGPPTTTGPSRRSRRRR